MASSFETKHFVEFPETDMAGIVHFSNFNRWMEQAEHAFFRSQGLKIVYHQPDGIVLGWPRVSANCRFESPARYEDVVDVQLFVERIGVKSLTYDIRFSVEGRSVARGRLKTVCCMMTPGQPMMSVPIPEVYTSKLEQHEPP